MTEAVLEQPDQSITEQSESTISTDGTANQNLEQNGLQELAVVIAIKGFNPASFTPDFLVNSGIIPADWILLRQPVVGPQASQVVFQNGISLTAEPGKLTFSESIAAKADEELQVAQLAQRFVEALPKADYVAVGINPQQVVPFTDRPQTVQAFMSQTLLKPGQWQELGTEPLQASMNLFYQLEDCRLQLNLNPTELRLPDDSRIPALLFAANFHRPLVADEASARQQQVVEAIARWQDHLTTYRSVIEDKFLGLMSA